MKFLKIYLTILLISQSGLFSQSGWVQQNSGTSNGLRKIHMINENTGFIGGYNNTFIKTTNGGMNWIQNSICSLNSHINSISFINETTGFVAAGYYSPQSPGMLSKTINGGLTWECVSNLNPFYDLVFFNNVGYGVYAQWGGMFLLPVLKKTTDNGQTWNTISSIPTLDLFFLNVDTGFFNEEGSSIYKTTNAGVNWNSYQISTIDNRYFGTFFVNTITGYTIPNHSQHHYIYKTTNGGINWFQLNTGLNYSLLSLYFLNESTGYSTSINSRIFKTTNGGINWISQNFVNNSFDLVDIKFVNTNIGYAIGDGGIILKTTNGGEPLLIQQISIEIPKNFSLSQNYPNPFNPATKIRFDISGTSSAQTLLSVYDLLGREVKVLVNEKLSPGEYEVDFGGANYPSGVYYYKLSAGDFSVTKKMVLVK